MSTNPLHTYLYVHRTADDYTGEIYLNNYIKDVYGDGYQLSIGGGSTSGPYYLFEIYLHPQDKAIHAYKSTPNGRDMMENGINQLLRTKIYHTQKRDENMIYATDRAIHYGIESYIASHQ
jgi:hypothetical protein